MNARRRSLSVLTAVVAAGFLVASLTPVSAAIINVPQDYPTIQSAIDAAADGDEVVVSPGRYIENIYFNYKNIILRSTDPTSPPLVEQTIIDGNQNGTVVTFGGLEGPECLLAGLTITNGGYSAYGGGILGVGCSATIRNNVIINNYARYGAGICLCKGVIENNVIGWNSAVMNGGGTFFCSGLIRGNLIVGNSAGRNGGGVEVEGIPAPQILNNRILQNSAVNGGGVCCSSDIPLFRGNLIADNQASSNGGGIKFFTNPENVITVASCTIAGNFAPEGGGLDSDYIIMINSIVWGNHADSDPQMAYNRDWEANSITYSCIQDWDQAGAGNSSLDPRFVDPAGGNYHLLSTSPCIDAGVPLGGLTEDPDGDPRPVDVYPVNLFGSDLDIGYDEYTGSHPVREASPEQPVARSPADGQTDVSPRPHLVPGPFCSLDPDAIPIAAEFWLQQGTGNSPASSPLYRILVPSTSERWQVPAQLTIGETYSWMVRYLDDLRLWSPWSDFATFTVGDTYLVPDDFPTIQQAIDAASSG